MTATHTTHAPHAPHAPHATRYLYLTRHGEATPDEGALTPTGRRQATLLGERLRGFRCRRSTTARCPGRPRPPG
ncbi:hypothetical protein SVIO_038630 [Streptomyces violaceusniger]|uniref:Phosphoglycerate mutase n=1 Tax=Streptomyces violaceusniger TaxID=68280 RepID=A0A4D4L2S7_STRVO|nr:hypothetical protein SVIO_038630 [Streptomyces violaceusniger]